MKKKFIVLICLLIAAFGLKAQIDNGVKRNIIARLDKESHVNDYEFVYNYYDRTNTNPYKKEFVAIVRNDHNDIVGLLRNEGLEKLPQNSNIRKIKIGYDNDCVVVNKTQNLTEIIINNIVKRYDTIVDLFENGYVYGSSGFFYYRDYNADISNSGTTAYCVPKRTVLANNKEVYVEFSDKPFIIHLNEGYEVYTLTEKHYYFIYKTSLMEQAVIIVDGKGYVLDGDYNSLRFKFSANSKNWILCCDDYLLINGARFNVKDKIIRDFFINNNGEFACILDYKIDNKTTSDLCINGIMHLKNVELFSLQLMNANEWIYKYKKGDKFFEGNGYFYKDYTNKSFYFDYEDVYRYSNDIFLKSDDEKHYYSYKSVDDGSVNIDGNNITTNRPHSVFWDKKKKAFVWTNYQNNALYLNTYNVNK